MRFAPLIVLVALSACAPPPPTSAELQTMQTAIQPSSPAAAQAAVKAYFAKTLIDPTAPLYQFPVAPVQGKATVGQMREFGWFMCGTINSKNRMGGYGGNRPFFVHFAPAVADKVDDGTIGDTDDTQTVVDNWCKGLYAQWPPG